VVERRGADPWEVAERDAARLRAELGSPAVALVLGSGWLDLVDGLGREVGRLALAQLEGVQAPTVEGHGGDAVALDADGTAAVVLTGRSHLYEGHDVHSVVAGVRAAVLAGARVVILSNAAGSLRPEVPVGTPVVISDQLNLTGTNPMVGPHPPDHLAGRFVDLTGLYSPRLREAAAGAVPSAVEGVYAGVLGGSFETPAEIRMLAALGADVVGMSTVLEAIAARHLGAEVFGVSLATNLAAGLQERLDHLEVLDAAAASAEVLAGLLLAVVDAV